MMRPKVDKELRRLLDDRRWSKNLRWLEANRANLRRYEGRFVAVDGERLVGVADDADELEQRLADCPDAYITWLEPEDLLWV